MPVNRILFQPSEIQPDGTAVVEDRRADHIRATLHGKVGQNLRAGVIGGMSGTATIAGITGAAVTLRCLFDQPAPPRPRVDLVLAMPRPKVMRRLWMPLASMGVGTIVITDAARVEKYYFDTHWLAPNIYTPLLIEGLEQSGDTLLPRVVITRRLKPFLENELELLCPGGLRIIGHPSGAAFAGPATIPPPGRITIAVGPEGGWTDGELTLFTARGFHPCSLGWRTLRSDTACIAFITLARAALESISAQL